MKVAAIGLLVAAALAATTAWAKREPAPSGTVGETWRALRPLLVQQIPASALASSCAAGERAQVRETGCFWECAAGAWVEAAACGGGSTFTLLTETDRDADGTLDSLAVGAYDSDADGTPDAPAAVRGSRLFGEEDPGDGSHHLYAGARHPHQSADGGGAPEDWVLIDGECHTVGAGKSAATACSTTFGRPVVFGASVTLDGGGLDMGGAGISGASHLDGPAAGGPWFASRTVSGSADRCGFVDGSRDADTAVFSCESDPGGGTAAVMGFNPLGTFPPQTCWAPALDADSVWRVYADLDCDGTRADADLDHDGTADSPAVPERFWGDMLMSAYDADADGTVDAAAAAATATTAANGVTTDAHTGRVVWSDATAATHDTGDLVCAVAGGACVTTYALASATPVACSFDWNTVGAVVFEAVCR